MKKLASLILLPLFLLAQGPPANQPPRFVGTTGDQSLSTQGLTVTVQQNASPTRKVTLEAAVIYCSVACAISMSQNGTAATSTAGSLIPVQPIGPAATASFWTSSNVGAGTTIGAPIHISSTGFQVISLSSIYFSKTSTSSTNFTISIGAISGTASITVYENEQ